MKRVLVVEDEASIREFVIINLQRAGYQTVEASSGEEALQKLSEDSAFQVILLDIMMPGMDGMEVCREIRRTNRTVGIMMLTARSQEMDKVSALMTGADDYMTKPFSTTELVARVDSLSRRVELLSNAETASSNNDELVVGQYSLNRRRRALYKNGKNIELTPLEYQIVELLITNANVPIDRLEILKRVWGDDYIGEEKIVDVNVRRLRMKVEDDPSNPRNLLTVWGRGYKWNAE